MNSAIISDETFVLNFEITKEIIQDYQLIFLEYVNQLNNRCTDQSIKKICNTIYYQVADSEDAINHEKMVKHIMQIDDHHQPQFWQKYTRHTLKASEPIEVTRFAQMFIKMYSNVKYKIYIFKFDFKIEIQMFILKYCLASYIGESSKSYSKSY